MLIHKNDLLKESYLFKFIKSLCFFGLEQLANNINNKISHLSFSHRHWPGKNLGFVNEVLFPNKSGKFVMHIRRCTQTFEMVIEFTLQPQWHLGMHKLTY